MHKFCSSLVYLRKRGVDFLRQIPLTQPMYEVRTYVPFRSHVQFNLVELNLQTTATPLQITKRNDQARSFAPAPSISVTWIHRKDDDDDDDGLLLLRLILVSHNHHHGAQQRRNVRQDSLVMPLCSQCKSRRGEGIWSLHILYNILQIYCCYAK
jgi:hypothetical protein